MPDVETDEKKSGLGRKLLGLFVETPEDKDDSPPPEERRDTAAADARSAAAEVAAIAASINAQRPPAPAPAPVAPVAEPKTAAPPPPDAPLPAGYKAPDFDSIFKTVGLPEDDRDRLMKAEGLLKSLPKETPPALQRQIVEASLRAFGIAPEKITTTAQAAIVALDSWNTLREKEIRAQIEKTAKRLQELQAEQERLQAGLSERQAIEQALLRDVRIRQSELGGIIDFFGGVQTPNKPSPRPAK
jgi:hypothetical protein